MRIPWKAGRIPPPPASPIPQPTFQAVSPKIKIGETASILVYTLPRQVCTMWFMNPGAPNQNQPIPIYRIAGEDGLCAWKWNVSPDTKTTVGTIWIWAGGKAFQRSFDIIP